MGREFINGQMGESTRVCGKKIKCMVEGYLPGRMEEFMMESMWRISNIKYKKTRK